MLRTFIALCALASIASSQASVSARAETTPVPSSGDAADDPAIWVDPTDPSRSVVIGTDKQSGLAVYDLTGRQLQFLSDGEPNNVDLRKDFPLGSQRIVLVTASDRAANRIAIYKFDPSSRTLSSISARTITLGINVYGSCLYRSPVTDDFYFIGTSKEGGLEQWRLFDNGAGKVDATRVRSFDVGGQCEGCTADDELSYLFVGEETVGVWRYGAEPSAGTSRISVDSTSGPNLTADVEGLSIYYASGGCGYLLVSSQGDSTFSAYERQAPHNHVLNFQIVSGAVDGVSDCDGLDVTNLALGSAFPDGLFVAQDGSNTGGNQNFKLLSWRDIANAASPALVIDRTYDPHGASTCTTPASWAYRSGANPSLLTDLTPPVLGTTWSTRLDCTGSASSGLAYLAGFTRPGSGVFVFSGEVLVDSSSVRLLSLIRAHGGGAVRFDLGVPNDLVFCGMRMTAQGACFGSPGLKLSNAIDLTFGN